ncbi:MAG: ABC transporter ATP-binding protein [Nitrospira sp.]|nr:ABC transporter ATP-binding protein [Nitrospira sp.]
MEVSISVNNLTKAYRVYNKPSDRLKCFFFRNIPFDVINAIDDVSFFVNRGETFGIIGENGAGKSTLLKVLSGVLTPTSGQVEVNGNVLSILELGVGFHPEFTGRENIFFYGDVLGFGRSFIKSKIDEIINFSELGLFIDKPIKTYSSGMLMRLAFSIVSSFEPDILILDEVLAVGDIHFQRKSLNKVLGIKKRGKTILFCSHDTYHIRMICDRVIWLKDGKIEMFEEAERVVSAYESYQFKKDEKQETLQTPSTLPVIIEDIQLLNGDNLMTGDTLCLLIKINTIKEAMPYNLTVSIKLADGRGVYVTGTHLNNVGVLRGQKIITIKFPAIRLLSGNYYAHVRVFDETGLILYHERSTPYFNVQKQGADMGICYLENEWRIGDKERET